MCGALSKAFNQSCAAKTCRDILHPGLSCTEAAKRTVYHGAIGSFNFYFPVLIIPMLLKYRKWKRVKVWKDFLVDSAKCYFFGFSLNVIAFIGVCCSYNYFNRFFLPTVICLPIAIGSVPCFILPPHILKVEGQGLMNMYIEFLIRRARTKWIGKLRESKVAGVVIFSALHACIMLAFLKRCSKSFWFSSLKVRDDENDDKCKSIHENLTCFEYWKQELLPSLAFAFGVSGAKILPRLIKARSEPKTIPKILLKKFDYGLIMFCLSINGIFKYLFCLLNRKTSQSIERNCLISSLVSGVGYIFYPRLIVFTLAITNAIESTYHMIQKRFRDEKLELPQLMKIINRVPLSYLMFIFGASMGINLRIFYPSLVNKYTHKVLSVVTNGQGDRVALQLIHFILGFD